MSGPRLVERVRGLERDAGLGRLTRSLALIGLMLFGLRMASPLAAWTARSADARYLAPAEAEAAEVLRQGTPDIGKLTDTPAPYDEGILGAVSRVGSQAIDSATELARAVEVLIANSESLFAALLTLFTLAITRLVLNGVILPIGCVWISWALARGLVGLLREVPK